MKPSAGKKSLTKMQQDELLATLEARFAKHPERHKGIAWGDVEVRLLAAPAKLWSLREMEDTGGAPDVVGRDGKAGGFLFFDCATQSPKGRTALCYDREGLDSRKEHKPKDTAVDMAAAMGISLLAEDQYAALQKLGEFDTKTSSWLETPAAMRKLGGALYGDRRYGRVFFGHNGAQSYYSGRGFRGWLAV